MTPSPGRPPPRRRHGLATAAVLAVGVACAALAQTADQGETPESLQQRLEADREREAALKQQLETGLEEEKVLREKEQAEGAQLTRVRRQLVATARKLQGKEAALSALEQELADLDDEYVNKERRLRTRLRQRREVLSAIVRIMRFPPQAMSVLPAPPIETVRGLIVFRGLEPTLRSEAAGIETELKNLAAVRAEKSRKREAVAKATTELETEKGHLERLQAEKASLVDRTRKAHRASVRQNQGLAGKLSEQAKSIRELIELIGKRTRQQEREAAARRAAEKAEPEAPEAQVAAAAIPKPGGLLDFTREKDSLWPPVQGPVVRRYGEKDEFGATSKGIVLEGRAGAQVVAPFDGEVVFAGPFRGYGRILLIEHGGGYHTLLAGLGRIDSVPGQWLLAGEPVAVMGDGEAGRTRLYVEFRRNGRPINPRPYMAVAQNRTSG